MKIHPSEIVTELRIKKGYSKKQLAEIVGVSPATITAMEDGQNKNYHVGARALGVSPEFILRGGRDVRA